MLKVFAQEADSSFHFVEISSNGRVAILAIRWASRAKLPETESYRLANFVTENIASRQDGCQAGNKGLTGLGSGGRHMPSSRPARRSGLRLVAPVFSLWGWLLIVRQNSRFVGAGPVERWVFRADVAHSANHS